MRCPFFLSFVLLLTSCRERPVPPDHPNIVLILADDLGYSDLSCMGGEIPTPNLDRLAANGLLLPNFYNAARCCPTRAALLTGLYPHQAGMGDMVEGRLRRDSSLVPAYQGWLGDDVLTLAEALHPAGYQTFLSGKWQLGNQRAHWPDRRGFDRNFAMIHGAGNYFNNEPWLTEDQLLQYTLDGAPYELPDSIYLTDLITDFALKFVESEDSEDPFFLYLSYTAPHWPLHAPEAAIDRFRGQYLEGWDVIRRRRFEQMQRLGWLAADLDLPAAFHNVLNPALSPDWDTLSPEHKATWDLRMAVYAAQVHLMDQNIGRLLDLLAKKDQLENTLIFFLSDNGATDAAIYLARQWVAERDGPTGSARSFDAYGARWANVSNTPYPLFKSTVAEGGIKTPLIVHFPAEIPAGQRSERYGHVIDLLPTCLEMAGLDFFKHYR